METTWPAAERSLIERIVSESAFRRNAPEWSVVACPGPPAGKSQNRHDDSLLFAKGRATKRMRSAHCNSRIPSRHPFRYPDIRIIG